MIETSQFTDATVDGSGVFDVLMRSTKAHLDVEYQKGRIKGPEYSTVYLGNLEAVMRTALEFVLQRERASLEAQLLEQQIALAQVEVQKAEAQVALIEQQTANALAEHALITANAGKVASEVAHLEAQTDMVQANLEKVPLEKSHITAQTELVNQQKSNLIDEMLTQAKQRDRLDQEISNLAAQEDQIVAETGHVTQQTQNLASQKLQIDAQTGLIEQQTVNAVTENETMLKQQCKLTAEFDVLMGQVQKITTEKDLLSQKITTERAQTLSTGVDPDSVLGRQKALYHAQTEGFARDAEQKAAKIMVDVWNVQRTTDEGVSPNAQNRLTDSHIGQAVAKMLSGVGA